MLRAIQRVTGSTRRGTEPPARGEQTRPPGWLVADPGGQDSDLDAAGQVQFAQYVGYMDFTVFSATDIRTAICRLVRLSPINSRVARSLPVSSASGSATGGAVPYPFEQLGRGLRVQQRPAGTHRADRRDQIQPGDVLEHEPSTAGQHRLQHHLLIGVGGVMGFGGAQTQDRPYAALLGVVLRPTTWARADTAIPNLPAVRANRLNTNGSRGSRPAKCCSGACQTAAHRALHRATCTGDRSSLTRSLPYDEPTN